jgi:PadR family transcriptional regulator, regulatory protein PadR
LAEEQKVVVRPRNWLTPVALVILHEQSSYGYELMERLATEFNFEQINSGTLYRTLRQLEKEGLCDSEWETSEGGGGGGGGGGGRARRMYYITEAGEAYLEAWVQASKGYQRVMDALARAYASRTTPRSSSEHGEEDEASA